jgi:hypothetical protein
MERIALEHRSHAPVLFPAFPQVFRGFANRLKVEVEANNRRSSRHTAEAVTAFAAARVKQPVTRLDIKPLEIDCE